MRYLTLLLIASVLAAPVCVLASNCAQTSVGKTPLNDLGTGLYQGYQGGLYPTGLNTPPAAHLSAGLHEAMQIKKLAPDGAPSASGKIVLISVGMSNTTQEFSTFKPIADADPQKNPDLVIVDCAQGGKDAKFWANTSDAVWDVANSRLTNSGVNPNQVQAVWLKQAIAQENKAFPNDAIELQGLLRTIAQNIKAHYPNTRIIYLSSRIYAGYATTTLNPEPYAYQSAFSVKWLIEEQANGSAGLNYDPAKGAVRAPWLAWGPYLWADGLTPRSDGLIWLCSDLRENDGTHPDTTGRQKVASMLLAFLKSDKTAVPWFTNNAYAPSTIAQAKLASEGSAVLLTGNAVTADSTAVPGSIYIEDPDRTSGIRVLGGSGALQGSFVNVAGVVQTGAGAERYIDPSSVSAAAPSTFPTPLMARNAFLDATAPDNTGLLLRVCGKCTYVDASTFILDDGSRTPIKCVVPAGVSISPIWQFVCATGIHSREETGGAVHPVLRIRATADITAF